MLSKMKLTCIDIPKVCKLYYSAGRTDLLTLHIRKLPRHNTPRVLSYYCLRILDALGLLCLIGRTKISVKCDLFDEILEGIEAEDVPVGGGVVITESIGPTRKRIYISIYDLNSKATAFVKVAMDQVSVASLKREVDVLEKKIDRSSAKQSSIVVPAVTRAIDCGEYYFVVYRPFSLEFRNWQQSYAVELAKVLGWLQSRLYVLSEYDYQAAGWWRFLIDQASYAIFFVHLKVVCQKSLTVAACHGDLSPANLMTIGGDLIVLDWEDHCEHAPLYTDELNYTLQYRRGKNRKGLTSIEFHREFVTGKTSQDVFNYMAALAFLAYRDRDIAKEIMATWEEKWVS